jgi:hypothetical protein
LAVVTLGALLVANDFVEAAEIRVYSGWGTAGGVKAIRGGV